MAVDGLISAVLFWGVTSMLVVKEIMGTDNVSTVKPGWQ
jgi:hypothetical protein